MKKNSERGMSMIEVTVATLLLVTVVAGLYSAFISAYKLIQPRGDSAYNVARMRFENLYEAVRQSWWSTNTKPLGIGSHADGAINVDTTSYTRDYTVTSIDADGDGKEDYRKVTVKVTW